MSSCPPLTICSPRAREAKSRRQTSLKIALCLSSVQALLTDADHPSLSLVPPHPLEPPPLLPSFLLRVGLRVDRLTGRHDETPGSLDVVRPCSRCDVRRLDGLGGQWRKEERMRQGARWEAVGVEGRPRRLRRRGHIDVQAVAQCSRQEKRQRTMAARGARMSLASINEEKCC